MARLRKRIATVSALAAALLFTLCWTLTQPFVSPRVPTTTPPVVDADRLRAHVHALTTLPEPRSLGRKAGLAAAANYVATQMRDAGADVEEQVYSVGKAEQRNLIARFGDRSGARVVVGAHYDAYGGLPGADDNASGVAGIIELCRLLAREKPAAGIDVVAWTLEEPPAFRSGDMGSARHARLLSQQGVHVRAAISVEMIGFFTDAPGSQSHPVSALALLYPTVGNFIAIVGDLDSTGLAREVKASMLGASSLPVISLNGPRFIAGVDFSDHRSYWNHGWDAVMVTDTAFYRNPNYHEATDTEDTLDYRRMSSVVAGVYSAVMDLAGRERRTPPPRSPAAELGTFREPTSAFPTRFRSGSKQQHSSKK